MNKTSIVLLLSLVGLLTMSSYMSTKPIEQVPFLQAAKTAKKVAQANTDDLIPTDDQVPANPADDELPIDDGEIVVNQEDEEDDDEVKSVVAKKIAKKVVKQEEEEDDEDEEETKKKTKVTKKAAAKKVVKQEEEDEDEAEEDDETLKKTAAKQAAEKKTVAKKTVAKKAAAKKLRTQKPEREDEDAFDATEAYTKTKYVKKLAAYSNSTYSQYYNGTYIFRSQNWTCQADQRRSYGSTPVVATNVFNASSLLRYFDLQLPYYTAPTQYFTWDTYFGELYRPTTLILKTNLTSFDYSVVCKRWN